MKTLSDRNTMMRDVAGLARAIAEAGKPQDAK
jgi:hypothetical protein